MDTDGSTKYPKGIAAGYHQRQKSIKTLSIPTLIAITSSSPHFPSSYNAFYGVLGESSIIAPNVLPFKAVVDFPKASLREVRGVDPI